MIAVISFFRDSQAYTARTDYQQEQRARHDERCWPSWRDCAHILMPWDARGASCCFVNNSAYLFSLSLSLSLSLLHPSALERYPSMLRS